MNKLGLALSFVAGMAGCDGQEKITPTCNTGTFHDIANQAQSAIDKVLIRR